MESMRNYDYSPAFSALSAFSNYKMRKMQIMQALSDKKL